MLKYLYASDEMDRKRGVKKTSNNYAENQIKKNWYNQMSETTKYVNIGISN